jgi:hypothetical protein
MDLQKEREAFESAMFKMADGQTKTEINPVNGQYMYGVMEAMWQVWQAAKADAVPDGFVLVPIEPTREMYLAGTHELTQIDFSDLFDDSSIQVYKAMIEAQERGG